ncbi:MAG TPA: GNAT family N-acetyltransferase [Chthoniobacterales bacterium]|nr:GNAT family N-acetyltransferase [Chthoniobacterales bacterium]
MDYTIRPLTPDDEPLLWDMLHQALQTSEGAPSRDILKRPEYARYVEDWGREGDTGFVVSDKTTTEVLGAVWYRVSTPDAKGRAEKNEPTPELAFAVKSGQRKRGIGAALLTQLVKANPHHSAISIRASANNPAVRLYERFGFQIVSDTHGTVTMRREI